MKKNVFCLAVCVAGVVFAVIPPEGTPERAKYDLYRVTGGFLRDTRQQKGAVTIINPKFIAPSNVVAEVIGIIDENVHISVLAEDGVAFNLASPAVKGDATLFIADDPALPMSLVAPESHWAMVNIAPLKTEKKTIYEARVKKMLVRGILYLLGAANTRIKSGYTSCVTKAEDLDQIYNLDFSFEQISNLPPYFLKYGIVPYKVATYRDACQQGWAHSPTNKWQQKIWNRTHELPSDPVVIKFDPKKGK